MHIDGIIDIIDYVTGIGNISREQYIRPGSPCHIHIAIWLNFYTHLAASYSTFIVGESHGQNPCESH